MRTARVELVRVGLSPPEDFIVRAGSEAFQVCRATVDVLAWTARVSMFWPSDGQPSTIAFDALGEAIKREEPDSIPAIVRMSAEGEMVLSTQQLGERQRFAVAAVAAAARYSWAWDDSPAIAVNVDNEQISLDAKYNGAAWEVVEVIPPAV